MFGVGGSYLSGFLGGAAFSYEGGCKDRKRGVFTMLHALVYHEELMPVFCNDVFVDLFALKSLVQKLKN